MIAVHHFNTGAPIDTSLLDKTQIAGTPYHSFSCAGGETNARWHTVIPEAEP